MTQILNTNIASLLVQRNLSQSQEAINLSMERLSSGLRINSARDDAAGLAVSNALTSQIRGLNQAIRNANDGVSLSQVAEGAIQEATSILQRMREIAVQSSNGTSTINERANLQAEFTQLQLELDRISEATTFGGRKLLDGTFSTQSFQVGAEANQTINLSLAAISSRDIGTFRVDMNGSGLGRVYSASTQIPTNSINNDSFNIINSYGSTTIDVEDNASAKSIAEAINLKQNSTGVEADARTVVELSEFSSTGLVSFNLSGEDSNSVAINAIIAETDDLQFLENSINQNSSTTGITAVASGSSITLVSETGDDIVIGNLSGTNMIVNSRNFDNTENTASSTQLVSSGNDSTRITGQVRVESSKIYSFSGIDNSISNIDDSVLTSIDDLSILSQNEAQASISVFDSAIFMISSLQSGVAAVQSRLGSTISNLQNISDNATIARSSIQDADFAAETANLTRNQILQEAAIAILAQANALPRQVLSLLE